MIDQIKLICAITKELERQKVRDANTRQLSAIVTAANSIISEFQAENVPSQTGQGLNAWLASDDTGLSSRFMAYVLAGGPKCENEYPHDPSDFGRCYRFLRAVPKSMRDDVSTMAANGKTWAGLVKCWSELEKLWEKESPTMKCPRLYDRMKKIIQASGQAF